MQGLSMDGLTRLTVLSFLGLICSAGPTIAQEPPRWFNSDEPLTGPPADGPLVRLPDAGALGRPRGPGQQYQRLHAIRLRLPRPAHIHRPVGRMDRFAVLGNNSRRPVEAAI